MTRLALTSLLTGGSLVLSAAAHAQAQPRARLRTREAVELARAAVQRANLHPEVARAWLSRIRSAAWLPELRLGTEKDLGTREAIDPSDGTRYATYSLDELRLEARATWRLDRLVFDPEELRASRETVRLAESRQDLALMVVRLYYERRRLELESEYDSAPLARDAALRAARMEEISAALEALCGTVSIEKPEKP